MDFGTNLTPVEIIKKGAFGNYSGVTGKFYKNIWKEFKKLKDIDKKHYASDYYDASLN